MLLLLMAFLHSVCNRILSMTINTNETTAYEGKHLLLNKNSLVLQFIYFSLCSEKHTRLKQWTNPTQSVL